MTTFHSSLSSRIDHTLLRPEATESQIIQLCQEAREYSFFSVCINPSRVALARNHLAQSRVKVCSVVGFPLGANSTRTKAEEARRLVDMGANELDMVMNIGALQDRNEIAVVEDIEAVIQAAESIPVKVIIETALLSEAEKRMASECVVKAGAAFVKTCTGFLGGGATVEDIQLIRQTVGSSVQIKASGGIKTYQFARDLVNAGADRLGCSSSVQIVKEEREAQSAK